MGIMATPINQSFQWKLAALLIVQSAFVLRGFGQSAPAAVPVPINSAIYKWDQIASALGKNTQVVMQPSQSFFLVDVEKVVERAFSRTLKGKESES